MLLAQRLILNSENPLVLINRQKESVMNVGPSTGLKLSFQL